MSPSPRKIAAHALCPAGVPLAWRQLTARRLRFAAAVAGIAFASVMMLMQLGFHDALYDSSVLFHRSLNGELVLVSPQYDSLGDARSFPRRRLDQSRAVAGVSDARAVYLGMAPWKNPGTRHDRTIFVYACDPGSPPFGIRSDQPAADILRREDQVLFDVSSRPEFGDIAGALRDGRRVGTEINGKHVAVGGTFSLGTSFASDGNVLAGAPAFHRIFPQRTPAMVSIGVLSLAAGADVGKVRDELAGRLPKDVDILTRAEFERREKTYWAERTPIGFVIGAGMVIGFIVGAVIVYQILYADLSDHLREYAVLKATGCSDAFLHGVVVQQSVVLAVAGFIPAAVLSWGVFLAARTATSLPTHLDVRKSAIVLLLTLVMCLVSGSFALRILRQADPAEVF